MTNLRRLGEYIENNGVDVITGALPAATFVEIVDAARTAGAQIDVAMSPTGYDQAILAEFGQRAAGIYFFVNYAPFEAQAEGHAALLDAMTRFAPEPRPPRQELALTAYGDHPCDASWRGDM